MKKIQKIGMFLFLIIAVVSCFKLEQYPPEPQIEFIDFTFVDTVDGLENRVLNGTLHFSFVDGDGDIGFDTIQPQQNTVFLEKFKYQNGVATSIDLLIPLNYFVPKFVTEGNRKTLKGEIIINDLDENYPFNGDTVFYKFYIVDRAGNVSNIDSTGNLIIN